MPALRKSLFIPFLAFLPGCGDGNTAPETPAVQAIENLTGFTTGTVGEPVQARVRLMSASGTGVAGVTVAFTALNGGSTNPQTVTSGPQGEAATVWTLGTTAAMQQLRVSAGGRQSLVDVEARAGIPSELTAVSGNDQMGAPASRLPAPLTVTVTDAWGNPVSGRTVEFDVLSGGGTVSPQITNTASDGTAAALWTLGVGSAVQRVEVRSATLASVFFTATAILPDEPLSIAPVHWEMPRGQRVAFSAWTGSTTVVPLEWYVNGVQNGDASVGYIQSGVYDAPLSTPLSQVTVRAVNSLTGRSAQSVVRFTAASGAPTLSYTETRPRVIRTTSSDSMEVLVAVQGYAPGVDLEYGGRPTLRFQAWQTGIYRLMMPADRVLAGYVEGDLHNFAGYLVPSGGTGRYNYFVNIRDATVPDASVVPLAPDAQRTDYVLNLREDELRPGHRPDLLPRLYQFRPDMFDFVAVIEPVDFFQNRSYMALRNDVAGLGLSLFDNAIGYGSPQRLMGMVRYPITGFFDGGESSFSHEIGHRWANFLKNPPLSAGAPHWPPSSLARGVMGFSIPGSGAGGTFPYDVLRRQDGTFELACTGVSREFSDLSLYLMGLLPRDSVRVHYVLADPGAPRICGSTVQVSTATIADVIAANGPRTPDHASAQRDFATATIVLSFGRLLDADEMAFYSHMASRAEARTELHFTSGFVSGITKPFFLATGGRATMTTRMW